MLHAPDKELGCKYAIIGNRPNWLHKVWHSYKACLTRSLRMKNSNQPGLLYSYKGIYAIKWLPKMMSFKYIFQSCSSSSIEKFKSLKQCNDERKPNKKIIWSKTGLLHKAVVHPYTSDKNNRETWFSNSRHWGGINRPI